MKYMNVLINMFLGIDCGLCGSHSKNVVRGFVSLKECEMINNGEKNDEG